jgi:hypothetical protein
MAIRLVENSSEGHKIRNIFSPLTTFKGKIYILTRLKIVFFISVV